MPLLTFVLAVHREQAYLRECAASILDQDFADVELVAIDDASPDHVPELLDELAERDPRVRVGRVDERVGVEDRSRALAQVCLLAVDGEHERQQGHRLPSY